MINFRAMPPISVEKLAELLPKVKNLMNGAKFQFIAWTGSGQIRGQYLDYAGEWCQQLWSGEGKIPNRQFPELDLDWGSARE